MSAALKVGAFAFVALVVGAWLIIRIEDISVLRKKPQVFSVKLLNAQGLEKKAPVRMSGVKVGVVRDIVLQRGMVRVTIELERDVMLTQGSYAVVESLGFLGEKHLEVYPGPADAPVLSEQQELEGKLGVDWTRTLQSADAIAQDVKAVTQNFKTVLGDEVGEDRLERIVESLAETSSRLAQVMAENQALLHRTMQNVEQMSGVLKDTSEHVRSVAKKVDEGKGSLGQLIENPEAVNRLNSSLSAVQQGVDSVNGVVQSVAQTQVHLGLRTEYGWAAELGKGYATLDVVPPSSSRFYRLEVASQPRGLREWKRTRTTYSAPVNGTASASETKEEEVFRSGWAFSAMVGQKLGPLTLRAGMLESTGGAGIDFWLLQDKLRLTSEIWNFNRGELWPQAKIHAALYPWKGAFLMTGWDDFLNENKGLGAFFVGAGVMWNAEDIKYLLPSVPLP